MITIHRATLSGLEIAYVDEGQGDPILLIHGFPFDSSQWEPQVAAFSGKYRIIAPDLRGHGATLTTLGPYPMDLFATDLAGLLDHLQLEKVILGGLSMGGYIAFAFFRKYRPRVRALILADTRPQADTPEGAKGREDAARSVEKEGTAGAIERLLPKLLTAEALESQPEVVAKVRAMMERCSPTAWAAAQRGMAHRLDSTALLEKITVPTLIIVGEEDVLTPPGDSRKMHGLIPGSRLEVISAAAHVTTLEQPEAFNRILASFLEGMK